MLAAQKGHDSRFLQAHMHCFLLNAFMRRGIVQLIKYGTRRLRQLRCANDPELIATIVDLDTQPLFNLAQMFVELATKIREP